ncbi:MAG: DNA primase large subunit PriL [Nitrososphaerota archaeon]|nr:DNA primase large subunit PriL [Aigarchaeota archaeon]MDW8076278.1 DNA primase large subunit PriL [Nitrososphaerota archaeon]
MMSILLSLEMIAKYPFTKAAKDYVSSLRIDIESLGSPEFARVYERAKFRVKEALERGGRSYEVGDAKAIMDKDLEVELLSFPLALFMVAVLDDDFASRRFGLAEAIRAEVLISKERLDVVEALATEELNFNLKRVRKKLDKDYELAIHFMDYLREASRFNANEWKLVNRYLENGYVYITQKELARLMRSSIERYIIMRIKAIGNVRPPDYMLEFIKEQKDKILARKYKIESLASGISPNSWPPCMKVLHQNLIKGESLSHFANFALASFLINIGMSVDDILNIYANRSDFNEKIARYQIEHIAGMKGSRTKYTTPSCSTMQTHGLCIEQGRLCGGIKNPLSYVKRFGRSKSKTTDN